MFHKSLKLNPKRKRKLFGWESRSIVTVENPDSGINIIMKFLIGVHVQFWLSARWSLAYTNLCQISDIFLDAE